ncbi:tetratricopeptide repeat protein [Antarctobacter jejuensis]|uniref:tetratricopeptide repeat protein n=1 Tax=Antarctobacter jejuensis TaxID=1439938 RepID=UPI003FD4FE8B
MPEELTKSISLDGNFRLDVDGQEVVVTAARARAILAILATADDQKKARDALKAMLWPRSDEKQASGSMRTALSNLRKDLGPASDLLGANRTHLWLDKAVTLRRPENSARFFEDAPTNIGSAFETWLQTERSRSRKLLPVLRPQETVDAHRICIGILPTIERLDEPMAALLATQVLDFVVEALKAYEIFELFDFRDLETDHFSDGEPAIRDPDMYLRLSLTKVGSMAQLCATVRRGRQILWSHATSADQTGPFLFSHDDVATFANQTVDAILKAAFRKLEGGGFRPRRTQSMIGVVHQLYGMSTEGQHSLRHYLQGHPELADSALANACYALSVANTLGEGDPSLADLEEARKHALRALELDMQNPLVLAFVGHVFGFALRDFAVGAESLALARRQAPALPQVWDFSAMNAIYRGAFEDALRYSRKAAQLGQYSPYRELFRSSLAITATLTGEHETAVQVSRSVLMRLPEFLAVMRHTAASLSALGQLAEAENMVARVRSRDKRFSPDAIQDPSYPLPSPASRDAIGRTFRLLGHV